MRRQPAAPPLGPIAALAAALLLIPSSTRASGAVAMPLPLETVVRRASAVVLGRTLGVREVQVRIPIGETGLAPQGRTHLTFTVRQIGVRVEQVLGGATRSPAQKGTELWLTDPAAYQLGLLAERAEAGFVGQEVYRPHARMDPEKPGTAVIAFAETSADRAARGAEVAGLPDAWWQVATASFEAPSRRREVERLRRAAERLRAPPADPPARSPGTPSPRRSP